MAKVYLVLPDLSRPKLEAIVMASRELGNLGLLISYSTFKLKPVTLERLAELRGRADVSVMLDSGAYHMARLGLHVDVSEYASLASRHSKLFDVVVAPDAPGDADRTVARTVKFSKLYTGEFMPVVQGSTVEDYTRCFWELKYLGLARYYRLGVGGLERFKSNPGKLGELVSRLCFKPLHLFGVGSRTLRLISAYSDCIRSVDSVAWLHEIKYRRRILGDGDPVILNYNAIKTYIYRFYRHRIVG
jgi:queuine/archaeosine tRNA-ribosyltransferase